jgi:hypothetical protein
MIISYNKDTKVFGIKLEDSRFGLGTQTVKYDINCCNTSTSQFDIPPTIVTIKLPINIATTTSVNSITIDGNTYSCAYANYSNAQAAARAQFPNIVITHYSDTYFHYIYLRGIPINTPVSMVAFSGANLISPEVTNGLGEYAIVGEGEEGLHTFTVTKNVAGVVITETACYFVDTNLICVIADYIAKDENKQSNVHLLYNTIKESIKCNCACADLCRIYRSLLLELNLLDRCKIC